MFPLMRVDNMNRVVWILSGCSSSFQTGEFYDGLDAMVDTVFYNPLLGQQQSDALNQWPTE